MNLPHLPRDLWVHGVAPFVPQWCGWHESCDGCIEASQGLFEQVMHRFGNELKMAGMYFSEWCWECTQPIFDDNPCYCTRLGSNHQPDTHVCAWAMTNPIMDDCDKLKLYPVDTSRANSTITVDLDVLRWSRTVNWLLECQGTSCKLLGQYNMRWDTKVEDDSVYSAIHLTAPSRDTLLVTLVVDLQSCQYGFDPDGFTWNNTNEITFQFQNDKWMFLTEKAERAHDVTKPNVVLG